MGEKNCIAFDDEESFQLVIIFFYIYTQHVFNSVSAYVVCTTMYSWCVHRYSHSHIHHVNWGLNKYAWWMCLCRLATMECVIEYNEPTKKNYIFFSKIENKTQNSMGQHARDGERACNYLYDLKATWLMRSILIFILQALASGRVECLLIEIVMNSNEVSKL